MRFNWLFVIVLAGSFACGDKKDEAGPNESKPGKTANKTGKRRISPYNKRQPRQPPTLTVAEAESAVPVPEGVRRLAGSKLMSGNRVVRTSYCADGTVDVTEVLGRFTKKMKDSGWRNVRTARKRSDKRQGASGQHKKIRVALMAQVSEFPECAKSKKQTRIIVSVYKMPKSPNELVRDAMRGRRDKLRKQAAGAKGKTPAAKTTTTKKPAPKKPAPK